MKDELTKPGLWTMGFGGFGETLPYHENRMYLDKDNPRQVGHSRSRFRRGIS